MMKGHSHYAANTPVLNFPAIYFHLFYTKIGDLFLVMKIVTFCMLIRKLTIKYINLYTGDLSSSLFSSLFFRSFSIHVIY